MQNFGSDFKCWPQKEKKKLKSRRREISEFFTNFFVLLSPSSKENGKKTIIIFAPFLQKSAPSPQLFFLHPYS